ncbi:hypothetical protein ARALYDRAFT_921104 [Arabidopsis lyrata subsp. lyrata]|uniref:Uncharacterized protein n=1 Tax=Arabidopsis lyrata subsp. lyrata TaxID=81972 RepID=D7MYD7_ARALL|nr:hypothetical protein ARALYDRAFT_921104 [Arabidopsis lyrata subsp. lyrata]
MTNHRITLTIYKNEIFDIINGYLSDYEQPDSDFPKTPIVCNPSEFRTAIVKALHIANIDPQRTEALPELWESEAKPEKVSYSGKLAIETPVTA